jgi:N-acetylmuramic acid 6-phosphate (MurNAc-6-P) etherase
LDEARARGATTVLLTLNPNLKIPRQHRPHIIIAPDVGPELLTGSTRLKSGTATKLVLNILTTLAMVKTGKVISNLMVDVNPSNVKLRARAVRIVRTLTGWNETEAHAALVQAKWVIKDAVRKSSRRPRPR